MKEAVSVLKGSLADPRVGEWIGPLVSSSPNEMP